MLLLHALGMAVLRLFIRSASFAGHPKARLSWRGRKGWEHRFSEANSRAQQKGKTQPWIHVHCASLGEYEQAAPILERLRKKAPARPILLTFFSPSGRESTDESAADHIDYLPWDTPRNIRVFASILNPKDTILIKYELWPALIRILSDSGTRIHLVASRFDQGRHPATVLGFWIRRHLFMLSTLQVQDSGSAEVLSNYGLNGQVTGDPRIDRVLDTSIQAASEPVKAKLSAIQTWKGERKMLVAGSAWPSEWGTIAALNSKLQESGWCVLVAPHVIHGKHVSMWAAESSFPRTSQQGGPYPTSTLGLILDEVGFLKSAYQLGNLALVGGGWEAGVHNTLEAAVYGLPVAVGPAVSGFREIQALSEAGAIDICQTEAQLTSCLINWMSLEGEGKRENAGQAALAWIEENKGSADRIIAAIEATWSSSEKAK